MKCICRHAVSIIKIMNGVESTRLLIVQIMRIDVKTYIRKCNPKLKVLMGIASLAF
jgi:hypothetical protein